VQYICLLILGRDVNASVVNDEGWGWVPSGADARDDCNPLATAWLDNLRSFTSLRACNDLYRPNHAHLEASLVKVVHVTIVDAVLDLPRLESATSLDHAPIEYITLK
jgi:hypothetical protein